MNYLKRLNGRNLDCNLCLEISSNKWMVKTIRLYIDYLIKSRKLLEEDGEKLLKNHGQVRFNQDHFSELEVSE